MSETQVESQTGTTNWIKWATFCRGNHRWDWVNTDWSGHPVTPCGTVLEYRSLQVCRCGARRVLFDSRWEGLDEDGGRCP